MERVGLLPILLVLLETQKFFLMKVLQLLLEELLLELEKQAELEQRTT